jgi:lipoprotein-anchoring transpeptidase ErfK/SrfK
VGRLSLLIVFPLIAFVGALSITHALRAGAGPQRPELPASTSVDVQRQIEAEEAAAADRSNCAEIRGTEYRSDGEREWFIANCVATPAPVRLAARAPNPPPVPGGEVAGERWILIDLARQEASAMIGERPLYTALATTGKGGWETPTGTFAIVARVANETMTSTSIGAEEYYVLKDVLYTQYFTTVGHAIHLNYWRPDHYFGSVRSSHGCIGLRLADAEFFWRFARQGTRVTIQ